MGERSSADVDPRATTRGKAGAKGGAGARAGRSLESRPPRSSCLWAASAILIAACQREPAEPVAEREPDEPEIARVFSRDAAPLADMQEASAGFELSELPPPRVDRVIWDLLVPDDNPPTPTRIALGRRLYFDPRLSADGTISCATCHDPTRGFSDHRGGSEGIGGQVGRRNAPTVLNAALLETQFWDGRAGTLEEQARLPIINPIEMGQPNEEAAVAAIADDVEYQRMFREAFGSEPSMDGIMKAIAAFERTLVALDSPFDRFVRGDADAMPEDARAGFALFVGKARCVSCHPVSPSNPLFTDHEFHNIGVAARHQDFEGLARRALRILAEDPSADAIDELALATDMTELGRFMVTRSSADVGAFKTPQLRNVGVTAPYMHDGSLQTLWDVMDHYDKGGEANAFLDGGMEPLALTEDEIDRLVAFMFALTSSRYAEVNEREHARQLAISRRRRPIRDEDLAHRRRLLFENVEGLGDEDPAPSP